MKGSLRNKSALSQLIILICITLVSFFVVGIIGTLAVSVFSGIGIKEMTDLSNLDFTKPGSIGYIRSLQVVQFFALFLIPAWICSTLFSSQPKKYLGLKAPSTSQYFLLGITIMIVAIPLTGFLGELNRDLPFPKSIENWMKKTEDEAAKTIEALLTRHSLKDLVINMLCIAGLAAVGEELLFRGMVQRIFIKMFRSPWAGIIIAAFLFSAMHMQFYGFLPRFILGILLGATYWYSGSLWVAMLAHFIYDAFIIVYTYFDPSVITDENLLPARNMAMVATVSTILVVLILIAMKKKSQTKFEEVYAEDFIPVKDHPF